MKRLVVVLLVAFFATATWSDNLVFNPGFESGFTGWLHDEFGLYRLPQVHTGVIAASTGCVGPDCIHSLHGAFLEQVLRTVPGESYDLSFWVAENSGPASAMAVFWNGTEIAMVENPASNACEGTFRLCHFVEYSFGGLVATSDSTLLRVNGRQDPGYMIFDDFSVTQAKPTREPAGLMMLAPGLLAFGGMVRIRRKR